MQAYLELRKAPSTATTEGLAADITRHLYTRQYLGKAVVICALPIGMMSAARKQWLRLSRTLQRQRSSTLNADKILKYTHGIAHMQRLRFSSKPSLEQPNADVFFLTPEQLQHLPAQCLTIYLGTELSAKQLQLVYDQMPQDVLVVDYLSTNFGALKLEPKKKLDTRVSESWRQVKQFLGQYQIDIAQLDINDMHSVEAMDDALDTLLGISHRFLGVAYEFQRALELARPMHINKPLRETYDSFILLAHRVQALTPGAFSRQFLQVYNEDDTFFLYDQGHELLFGFGESLEESHARHIRAGRKHLANALAVHFYNGRSFQPAR